MRYNVESSGVDAAQRPADSFRRENFRWEKSAKRPTLQLCFDVVLHLHRRLQQSPAYNMSFDVRWQHSSLARGGCNIG